MTYAVTTAMPRFALRASRGKNGSIFHAIMTKKLGDLLFGHSVFVDVIIL